MQHNRNAYIRPPRGHDLPTRMHDRCFGGRERAEQQEEKAHLVHLA